MNELEPTGKVSRRNAVNTPSEKFKTDPALKNSSGEASDRVSLSQTGKVQASLNKKPSSNSEIRHDLVNRFKNILNNGSYEVKADEIADKIVQKIKEYKSRVVF